MTRKIINDNSTPDDKPQFLIETSDFFEILWVYVTFGVDYEYAKKIWKNLIFDHFYYVYDFFCSPKNKLKVGEKTFLVTFEEDPSTNIKKNVSSFKFTIFQ